MELAPRNLNPHVAWLAETAVPSRGQNYSRVSYGGCGPASLGSCGCSGKGGTMRSALGNVMGLGGLAAVTDTADLAADAAATDGTGSGELSEAQMNQLKRRLLVLGGGLGAVGALLALYHGYQRSGASLAMLGWGALGFFLPVVTIPVMLVQGYGEV